MKIIEVKLPTVRFVFARASSSDVTASSVPEVFFKFPFFSSKMASIPQKEKSCWRRMNGGFFFL